eukprot:6235369-Prymnesium_polylepis.1
MPLAVTPRDTRALSETRARSAGASCHAHRVRFGAGSASPQAVQVLVCMCARACVRACVGAWARACVRACVGAQARGRTCECARVRACACARVARVRVCTCARVRVCGLSLAVARAPHRAQHHVTAAHQRVDRRRLVRVERAEPARRQQRLHGGRELTRERPPLRRPRRNLVLVPDL